MSEDLDVPVARGWRTYRLPELAGTAEAAEILGIARSTLSKWMMPGSGNGIGHGPDDTKMIPPQAIAATPIWVRDDVERLRDGLAGAGPDTGDMRGWRTHRLPELAGIAEAVEILGTSAMTIGRWRKPGSGKGTGQPPHDTRLMEPRLIAAGPVWVAEDLRRFVLEIGRQRQPARKRT